MDLVRYCFVQDCFVGILTFRDDGEITMQWEDDSTLSDLAKKYKKYIPMRTTDDIKLFISERVIDERRPDRSIWLSLSGITNMNASKIEIFLGIHGVSINDHFWIDTIKSPQYWYDCLCNI